MLYDITADALVNVLELSQGLCYVIQSHKKKNTKAKKEKHFYCTSLLPAKKRRKKRQSNTLDPSPHKHQVRPV